MDWLQFISSLVGSLAWPLLILFIFCVLWHYFPKLAPFVRQLKYGDIEVNFHQKIERLADASASLVGTAQPQLGGPAQSAPSAEALNQPAVVAAPTNQPMSEMVGNDTLPAAPPEAGLGPLTAGSNAPSTAFARGGPDRTGHPPSSGDATVDAVTPSSDLFIRQLEQLAAVSPMAAVWMAWRRVEKAASYAISLAKPRPDPMNFVAEFERERSRRRQPENFDERFDRLRGTGLVTPAQLSVYAQLAKLKDELNERPSSEVSSSTARNYMYAARNLEEALRSIRVSQLTKDQSSSGSS